MATSTNPPVATSTDGPRGFSRVIERMRTVLRRSKTKRSKAASAAAAAATAASTHTPATITPAAAPTTTTIKTAAPIATSGPITPCSPGVTRIDRSKLFAERVQALSDKFGLEIKAPEWYSAGGEAFRVEKPIRMRVRRTCHLCTATFGASKECLNCQHIRCAECSRHPAKRTDAEREASRQRVKAILEERKREANHVIAVDWKSQGREERIVLRKPSKVPGAPDLVYKKPRQRVRRTCHVCSSLFDGSYKQCTKCSHIRCTDCPRDPAKKDKYPFGYPGDEFGPSAIPVHGCHECKAMFAPAAPDGTPCKKCSHEKCVQCLRLKPQKVVPEPDPALLASVEAKLAGLKV